MAAAELAAGEGDPRRPFRQRTRADWCQRPEASDVCCAPVLTTGEAPLRPHLTVRGTFVVVDGVVRPAPAALVIDP